MLLLVPVSHANAQDAPSTPGASPAPGGRPTAEARKLAARKYAEGTRDFDVGDFVRAGEAFESAYQAAPHHDSLWNAARAWQRAGELARAANLYAHYIREAPSGAPDRLGANAALGQLARKLARIDVHAGPEVTDPHVDDAVLEGDSAYVVPGSHLVYGRANDARVERRVDVGAGRAVSVLLAVPSPIAAQTANAPPVVAPAAMPLPIAAPLIAPSAMRAAETPGSPDSRGGWSPYVVAVEGGVTLLAIGFAIWSGLDTVGTLHDYEGHPTQASLDSGRSEETRTNVLLGASIGLAAITAATAAWLVDWSGGTDRGLHVGMAPGAASLSGTF